MRALNDSGAWWGWHGWHNRPRPMSIIEIIAAGSMTADVAALLWIMLERGSPIIVSSMPRNAGKTTTLTALLDFAPDGAAAYFSRGQDETFELPDDSGAPTYLMINELSDHLPIYTWGSAALRAFELLYEGRSLATTMHAEDARDTLAQLERGLRVEPTRLARLGVVLSLRARMIGREPDRHVSEMAIVRQDGSGYAFDAVARRQPEDASIAISPNVAPIIAARFGMDATTIEAERAKRRALLEALVTDGVTEIDAVRSAIQSYRTAPVEGGPWGGRR